MTQLARLTGKNAPKLYSPPVNNHVTDTGIVTEPILRGQLAILTVNGWSLNPTNSAEAHGIALMDYVDDQENCEFLLLGEMVNFTLSGGGVLVPGTPLWPSASVAGGIATDIFVGYTSATTPVVNVPATVRMRVASPNSIRVNFV